MKLSMEANRIKSAGEDLKTIARDYSNIVNGVYSKIQNMENNGVWMSEGSQGAAKQFISATLKDQPSAVALGNSISNLGSRVCEYASDMNVISDNKL